MSSYIIAEGGESDFHIVNHRYSDETVRFAASQLQKYLLASTGAVIPYFSDKCPKRSPEIRIGPGVRGETEAEQGLHSEGFCIRGDGENISITGFTSRGVLYGVYRFLELFCDIRFFTKEVEEIPRRETLKICLEGEIREEPAFEMRDAYFRFAFDGDFAAKCHFNSSLCDLSAAKGGRMKWFNCHHSFDDLVPARIWFEEHPEYFSLVKGERIPNGQLCLTNPEVKRIALETLRRWIRENPECTVFSVAQNDNRRRCQCPECLALEEAEGSPAGPIIHFVNDLADAIREEAPNVLLHTFAYQYSLPAPKKVVARDNVIVRLCSIRCRFDKPFQEYAALEPNGVEAEFVQALSDWKHHAKLLYVWDYASSFRNYLQPFFHFHTMAKNIRFFAENGVRGVLEQGNFSYGGGACGDDLKIYLIGRLLWNPDTDIDREADRFLQAVYGPGAAEKMKEYFTLMEQACSQGPLVIFQYPDAPYLSDELIEACDRMFQEAEDLAENEVFRRRIQKERLAIRYLTITRMELGICGRDTLVDEFLRDVKSHGLTEVMERKSLKVTRESMLTSRYTRERPGSYSVYYIMQ